MRAVQAAKKKPLDLAGAQDKVSYSFSAHIAALVASHPQQTQKQRSLGTPASARFSTACLIIALLLILISASACERNKKSTLPPQATAPTIKVPPTPQVGQQPAPPVQKTAPPATDAETGVIPRPPNQQTVAQPKPRNSRIPGRKTASKTPPPAPPPAQPAQPQPPPAKSSESPQVQIGAQVSQSTVQNTEQLLQTAEGNLRRVTRTLSDGEQAMVRQVQTYITQSRTATRDGDLERAHNLAMKANLLSVELAK